MKRRILIGTLCLLAVFAAAIGGNAYVRKTADALCGAALQAVRSADGDAASAAEALSSLYHKTEGPLGLFIPHKDADTLRERIVKLEAAVLTKDAARIRDAASDAYAALLVIRDGEIVNYENIF